MHFIKNMEQIFYPKHSFAVELLDNRTIQSMDSTTTKPSGTTGKCDL